MTHVGEALSALVDDELGAMEAFARDHALDHLAVCAECRSRVDAERRLRARLAALPSPEPSERLVAGLLAVPRAEAVAVIAPSTPSRAGGAVAAGVRRPGWRRFAGSPGARGDSRGPGRGVLRGRYVVAAGLAATVVVGLGGGSFAGGAGSAVSSPATASSSDVSNVSAGTFDLSADTQRLGRLQNHTTLSVMYRRP